MDLKTISALLRTSKDFSDKLRQNIVESGFNLTEFSILEALYQKGPLSVSALLEKVLVNNSTVSYTLTKLVKDDLVSVCQDAHDKRIREVSLTAKGKKTISDVAPKHYAYIESLTTSLTSAEEIELQRLLRKINRGI